MSTSYAFTESQSFTVTHARHIAAKVATDLKRLQRLYGQPSDASIAQYEEEVVVLLRHGYLESVSYGFKRNGRWIEPSLHYKARELGAANDDDPGRIRPGADITGASFYSYLTYSNAWFAEMTSSERETFERTRLPFLRSGADAPGIDGYMTNDRTYSSGGRSLERATVRSY